MQRLLSNSSKGCIVNTACAVEVDDACYFGTCNNVDPTTPPCKPTSCALEADCSCESNPTVAERVSCVILGEGIHQDYALHLKSPEGALCKVPEQVFVQLPVPCVEPRIEAQALDTPTSQTFQHHIASSAATASACVLTIDTSNPNADARYDTPHHLLISVAIPGSTERLPFIVGIQGQEDDSCNEEQLFHVEATHAICDLVPVPDP